MAAFIVLTAAQADQVRGPTSPTTALLPVERQGGVFILGAEVLADPAHVQHHAFLAGLPVMDSDHPAFPPVIELEE